ncbi:MAG TPA: hypothetical protein VG937_05500 [Polyangiaceae bacterium]|nr:hypothetical protein [Polyangiaceae bacterium]
MDFASVQQVPGLGRNGNDSGNWPVPLVKRKARLVVSPELDAAWFGGGQAALVDSGEHAPFQIVSRRRLRWAHALFLLAFSAVVALLAWEAHVHFAAGG